MSENNKISNLTPEQLDEEFIAYFDSNDQIVVVTRQIEYRIADFRNGRENWTPEAIFEEIKGEAIADMRAPVEKWELRFTNEDEIEVG